MTAELKRRVRRRARERCEYCRIPVRFDPLLPHVDHIIAEQHGGKSRMSNLAFACAHCNSHKGTNLTGVDPRTRQIVSLFHPRTQRWSDHFCWHGPVVVALTAHGRVTIHVLAMNAKRRVEARAALMEEGVY